MFYLDPPTIVIMGGPCAGKTTTVKLIEQNGGFHVAHEEAARIITEGKMTPRSHWGEFQHEVLRRQMAAEAALAQLLPRKPIFADRGIFDNIAYWQMKGKTPSDLPDMSGPRYKAAFLLEPLGIWISDGVRSEDLEFCRQITPIMEAVYTERGVPVFRIADMPAEDRVKFILETAQQFLP